MHLERLGHLHVEAGWTDWLAGHLTLAVLASYWYTLAHYVVTGAVLLFFVAEIIARWNDKRRARNKPFAGLSPDETSQL